MEIRPLTETIGAEITGVDLGEPLDNETRSRLYRCFADSGVLVFPAQQFDPPRFAAATQRKYVYRYKWRKGDMVIGTIEACCTRRPPTMT